MCHLDHSEARAEWRDLAVGENITQNSKISPPQNLLRQIFPVEMTHLKTYGDTVALKKGDLNENQHRPMTNIRKLGSTFDREAALYHSIRPRYPEVLFDALERVTHLPRPAQLLEIGPGTGQATITLANRDHHITAIEIGPALAEMARRELRTFSNVDIITGAFEDINLPPHSFDLIFAATSFHWIKPGIAFHKSRYLLKPDGHLAIIHTHHISDEKGDLFYHASQPIYQKYFPRSTNTKAQLPTATELQSWKIDEKLFEQIHFETFPLTIHYTANEYAKLLNTYSPNLRLPANKRECFLREIEELINGRFEGILEKYFSLSLTVAKRQ